MRYLSASLIALSLFGCTSTRTIEARWDDPTRNELIGKASSVMWAVVDNPVVRDEQYRIRGPLTRDPFLTADSLFMERGFGISDVYEISVKRVNRGRGFRLGFIPGAVFGGLFGGYMASGLSECGGDGGDCTGDMWREGGVVGGVVGGLLAGGVGALIGTKEVTVYRFANGAARASIDWSAAGIGLVW